MDTATPVAAAAAEALSRGPPEDAFGAALALFHRHSTQNPAAVAALQALGILPARACADLAILDIGAGEGRLPALLQPFARTLVLVEPNPGCVARLRRRWPAVRARPWDDATAQALQRAHPAGFDLVTMSHMLYHLDGLAGIRAGLRAALALVRPGGHLAVVVNQPSAPTVRAGVAFMRAQGRHAEAATNEALHRHCHDPGFYADVGAGTCDVTLVPVACPLRGVPSRTALVALLRMPLLDPRAARADDLPALDAWLAAWLDREYPGLAYPATLDGTDDLVAVRRR
ncbi:MAG: methyltransferase domain-containing protein [Burkholderiales bacterium]